jgi:translation initiation factor IF-2
MAKIALSRVAKELNFSVAQIKEWLTKMNIKLTGKARSIDEETVHKLKEFILQDKNWQKAKGSDIVQKEDKAGSKWEGISEIYEERFDKQIKFKKAKKIPRKKDDEKAERQSKVIEKELEETTKGKGRKKKVILAEGVTVKELAEKLNIKSKYIIKKILQLGVLATINQQLDKEVAIELCKNFGYKAEILSFEEEIALQDKSGKKEKLDARNPVVTIMGHVDHGKTSLLDAIRASNIIAEEKGGITQHIGAYLVKVGDRGIVFLDTPGHEAFTLMRARGAEVTDIVVLVVAADDGVMPQTIEAINHAKAADVPIIVAINKIDKPQVNIDKVKKQLTKYDLVPEAWGGKTVFVEISAKKKIGLELLLEMILLVADMMELKADVNALAQGSVLEAQLDKAQGPVATVLISNGILNVGDYIVAGSVSGRVRAIINEHGERLKNVGPEVPIELLGLHGVPQAGDSFQVVKDEAKARQVVSFRQAQKRQKALLKSSRMSLETLYQQVKEGIVKELPIILKCDVQGSLEVVTELLAKLSSEKVKLKVVHSGTGAINESDVLLASASNAIIIGFNVRPERKAQELAESEKVDIRLHTVIYNISNEIKNAMVGLLEPAFEEVFLGRAEVRNTFRVPKAGIVAGCYVLEGLVVRNSEMRLLRDHVVIHEGRIDSLKRFKDDATEVKAGLECGIGISNFNDIKIGDIIECFKVEKKQPEEL